MKILKLSAVLLWFAALPATASNNFISGNSLHSDLVAWTNIQENRATGGEEVEGVRGISYVMGVSDALSGQAFCITSENTAGQLAAVVRKYLEDHPDRWQFTASSLVVDALHQAFPCVKN